MGPPRGNGIIPLRHDGYSLDWFAALSRLLATRNNARQKAGRGTGLAIIRTPFALSPGPRERLICRF